MTTEETKSLRDEIISNGTSPRNIVNFVTARFVATDITDKYAAFTKEVDRLSTTPEKMTEVFYAHSICLAALIHAVARGNAIIENDIVEMIQDNLNKGQKK